MSDRPTTPPERRMPSPGDWLGFACAAVLALAVAALWAWAGTSGGPPPPFSLFR